MLEVLFVNVPDRNYPRHQRLIRYFAQRGYKISVIDYGTVWGWAPLRPLFRGLRLIYSALTQSRRYDVVVLSEFALAYAVCSWVIARLTRAVHVVDGFVGLHETLVEDRQFIAENSVKARGLKLLDRVAFRSADIYLVDTEVRAQQARTMFGPGATVMSLPVGAPDWIQPTTATYPRPLPLQVLYYGNYVPLHGVPLLLEAIAAAAQTAEIRLTLVGAGQTRPAAEQLVRELGISDICDFRDPVRPEALSEMIARHQVVAGVFGDSPKAQTVIANKVWQGLASGVIVVTRRSTALDEIRGLVSQSLVEVDISDACGLAAHFVEMAGLMAHGQLAAPDTQAKSRLERYVAEEYEMLERAITSVRGPKARVSV